ISPALAADHMCNQQLECAGYKVPAQPDPGGAYAVRSGYSRGSLQCVNATLAPARFPEALGGSNDLAARIAGHQPCPGVDGGGRSARDTCRDGPDWLAERSA